MPKLAYIREPGVINLSYSRLQTLHKCPRKFQLREKYATGQRTSNVHTEFGHAYAAMVQEYFRAQDIDRSIVAGMAAWDLEDLFVEKPLRSNKCWEEVLIAFDCFVDSIYPAYFKDRWKLADLGSIPAIETLCYINIYGRYSYQAHIDLILQSLEDNSLAVTEIKTTERVVHPAIWQNSSQATTYSLIVDKLAQDLSLPHQFKVIYLVYNPKQEEQFGHTIFHFDKTPAEKVNALNSLLLECHAVQLYEDANFYPKNGDSCYDFYRACELFGLCDLQVLHEEENTAYEILPVSAADIYLEIEDMPALHQDYHNSQHIPLEQIP